jgi:hypothetical protein
MDQVVTQNGAKGKCFERIGISGNRVIERIYDGDAEARSKTAKPLKRRGTEEGEATGENKTLPQINADNRGYAKPYHGSTRTSRDKHGLG